MLSADSVTSLVLCVGSGLLLHLDQVLPVIDALFATPRFLLVDVQFPSFQIVSDACEERQDNTENP